MRVITGQSVNQYYTLAQPGRDELAPLIIMCHGAGYGWNFVSETPPEWAQLQETIRYLTERGYAVATAELFDFSLTGTEGETWGNNASTTQLAAVIADIKTKPNISQGKVGLIGLSMGNITIANHMRRAGTSGIAGALGVIPAAAISAYRGTDASQGVWYNAINAAFGVANDAAFNAAVNIHEPLIIAPSIDIPWGFWGNSDDGVAPLSLASIVAATVPNGKGTVRDMGLGGHEFNNLDGADVYDFFANCSW